MTPRHSRTSRVPSLNETGGASAKTGVRLLQVETKHMQLHAHAADDADAFAEIDLRVAGRMDERDADLARSGAGDPHVILHHRVAASVAMFDPQPFENIVAPCGSGSGTESQVSYLRIGSREEEIPSAWRRRTAHES